MKQQIALLVLTLLILPAATLADSHEGTVAEVTQVVEADLAEMRATKSQKASQISKHGSYEFWSSGGLLNFKQPDGAPQKFDTFNLRAKHIQVVPLADDVALAMYYSEGTMQPKGHPDVVNYRTRVMVVYVKEDGAWKQRAGHWSPLAGGSGTSQTVE